MERTKSLNQRASELRVVDVVGKADQLPGRRLSNGLLERLEESCIGGRIVEGLPGRIER